MHFFLSTVSSVQHLQNLIHPNTATATTAWIGKQWPYVLSKFSLFICCWNKQQTTVNRNHFAVDNVCRAERRRNIVLKLVETGNNVTLDEDERFSACDSNKNEIISLGVVFQILCNMTVVVFSICFQRILIAFSPLMCWRSTSALMLEMSET